jgi:DNA-binding NtrC family response regulator
VSLFSDTLCENDTPWRFEAKRVSQQPNDGSFPEASSSTVKGNSFQFFATTTLTPAGGKGGAAELLGMKRTSLYTRMKNLGMNLPRR